MHLFVRINCNHRQRNNPSRHLNLREKPARILLKLVQVLSFSPGIGAVVWYEKTIKVVNYFNCYPSTVLYIVVKKYHSAPSNV